MNLCCYYMHKSDAPPPKGILIYWWCFIGKIKFLKYLLEACLSQDTIETVGINIVILIFLLYTINFYCNLI